MNLEETLNRIKTLGDEKVRKQNAKNGAHENQFGVKLGDIISHLFTIITS